MAELPKEWREIAEWKPGTSGAAIDIVERCYALHTKPQRELTDAEIEAICEKYFPFNSWRQKEIECCREAITAHQRKQREPETVEFRAARRKGDGGIAMFESNRPMPNDYWEWHNNPDGSPITVKVPV